MNIIAYAGKKFIKNKGFTVICSDVKFAVTADGVKYDCDEKCALILPPLTDCEICGSAIFVNLEQALLPYKRATIVHDDGSGAIYFAVSLAERYFNSSTQGRNLALAALGDFLTGMLTALSEKSSLSPVTLAVQAEILSHVSDSSYSLDDGLKKMPLNYDYIRKLFKKETGATPREYLLKERMTLAQSLLSGGISNRYSRYSVSQVAEACGFSEPLYFSKVFKKYFGKSPSELLKK